MKRRRMGRLLVKPSVLMLTSLVPSVVSRPSRAATDAVSMDDLHESVTRPVSYAQVVPALTALSLRIGACVS